jgi:FG-GAP repeat protein
MRRAGFVVAVAVATLVASALPAWSAPGRSRVQQADRVDFNGDGFTDLAVGAPGEAVGSLTGAGALNVLLGSADGLQPTPVLFFQGGGAAGTTERDDAFGAAVAKGDFNDDGFFDVAVGAPGEAVGSIAGAGAVNLLYGSTGGLTGGPLFTQANPESADSFGASLAAGDFDGDGFFDLAVGVPGEDVGSAGDAGAVTVLFGSAGGITTAGSQTLFQGNGGITGSAEDGDAFGHALATGLLANDDLADLVVGVPGENVGAISDAGAANVLAGSSGGLVNGSLATQGNPEVGDEFGAAVATGDFDDTAGDDPAVGAPGETVGGRPAAGAVSVFNGPPSGLAAERLLFQGTAGIPGTPETGDAFGAAVAPTDSNGIGQWDLAVGVPSESVGPDVQSGAVNLLAGSTTGPSGGTLVLQTNPEDFDFFGLAIAGGFFLHDFDNNGFFDLAVGAPLESAGSAQAVGAVSVLYASGGGVLTPGPAFLQGSGGLGGTAEAFDFFGSALE